jgi:hypothetical protein
LARFLRPTSYAVHAAKNFSFSACALIGVMSPYATLGRRRVAVSRFFIKSALNFEAFSRCFLRSLCANVSRSCAAPIVANFFPSTAFHSTPPSSNTLASDGGGDFLGIGGGELNDVFVEPGPDTGRRLFAFSAASLSFFSFSAACLVATRFAASSCGLSASSLAGIAGVASSSSETISATGQSSSSLSVAASADTSVDREEDASEGEFDDE